MAVKGEIFIKNNEGTDLEGSRENGSSLVFEFDHEVYLPFDKEENRIQGARRVSAFSVIKDIDKLTPQIYDIVCNGRKCTEIKVVLFRIAIETGAEEEYFHYILEDAQIVSVKNWMPSTKIDANENIGHLERVTMIASKITWKYLDGGIEYEEVAF